MTGGVLIAVWLRWTRAKRRRAEAGGRTFLSAILKSESLDPQPTARLLGTALANDQKHQLDTVRFMKSTPLMRISGVFCYSRLDFL